MNLIFHLPSYERDFLVDSLPFQEGTFEIELPVKDRKIVQSYPASDWKKLGKTKPSPK